MKLTTLEDCKKCKTRKGRNPNNANANANVNNSGNSKNDINIYISPQGYLTQGSKTQPGFVATPQQQKPQFIVLKPNINMPAQRVPINLIERERVIMKNVKSETVPIKTENKASVKNFDIPELEAINKPKYFSIPELERQQTVNIPEYKDNTIPRMPEQKTPHKTNTGSRTVPGWCCPDFSNTKSRTVPGWCCPNSETKKGWQ